MANRKFHDVVIMLFGALLFVSCFSGIVISQERQLLGFLGLFWGLLGLMVLLWLCERLFYYKQQIKKPGGKLLSDTLLENMERQKIYNAGIQAMKSFNILSISIFGCGMAYIFWAIWMCYTPETQPALEGLDRRILAYFSLHNPEGVRLVFLPYSEIMALHIMPLLIVGIVFWISQLLAYSNPAIEPVLIFAMGIFIAIFLYVAGGTGGAWLFYFPAVEWSGYGWGRASLLQAMGVLPEHAMSTLSHRLYATGITGVALFYLSGLCLVFVFLKQIFIRGVGNPRALSGLAVLFIMLGCDVFVPVERATPGLWIAGWSILGMLAAQSRHGVRKSYRLYQ